MDEEVERITTTTNSHTSEDIHHTAPLSPIPDITEPDTLAALEMAFLRKFSMLADTEFDLSPDVSMMMMDMKPAAPTTSCEEEDEEVIKDVVAAAAEEEQQDEERLSFDVSLIVEQDSTTTATAATAAEDTNNYDTECAPLIDNAVSSSFAFLSNTYNNSNIFSHTMVKRAGGGEKSSSRSRFIILLLPICSCRALKKIQNVHHHPLLNSPHLLKHS